MSPEKRVLNIVAGLTPKQFVLAWLHAIRQFPNFAEYFAAESEGPWQLRCEISYIRNAIEAAKRQTHGWGPDDQVAAVRRAIRDSLYLKTLITEVNELVANDIRIARLEAAIVARQLQHAVFHDQVSRDVRCVMDSVGAPAAAKVRPGPTGKNCPTDALLRLERYCLTPPATAIKRIGDRTRELTAVMAFVEQVCEIGATSQALLQQAYAKQHVASIVSRKYFGGQVVLYNDVEQGLATTITWLETVVGEFNKFVVQRMATYLDVLGPAQNPSAEAMIGCRPPNAIAPENLRQSAAASAAQEVEAIEGSARCQTLVIVGETAAAEREVKKLGQRLATLRGEQSSGDFMSDERTRARQADAGVTQGGRGSTDCGNPTLSE